MTENINLPMWLVFIGSALAAWALLDHVLLPFIRWFFRCLMKRAISKANKRLAIRLPSFKLTKRRELIDRLIYDSEVQEAVKKYCREQGVSNDMAMEKVKRYAKEIVPSFNALVYFRFGSWVCRSVSKLLYRVRIGFVDEAGLAEVDPQSSVVFIVNHRSNIDYILLGYLTAGQVALSFAVGEWARVWPIQQIIRALGGFFVRRGSGNVLYRCVLARYVQMAIEGGVVQAVFLEGKLSKDGRLGEPKLGILDYMLRCFDPDKERDLVFVPVGVNYDRVLEDRSMLLAIDPDAPKKSRLDVIKTTLFFLGRYFRLKLRGGLYRFGYVLANFGTPISMRKYVQTKKIDFRNLSKEERIGKVKILAQELMQAVRRIVPVAPVPLIACVFVENPERSFSELEIKARAQNLIDELEKRGALVYIPRSDRDYAIEVGLRMLILRHIVLEEDNLFRAAPEETKILHYYANSITHFFDSGFEEE